MQQVEQRLAVDIAQEVEEQPTIGRGDQRCGARRQAQLHRQLLRQVEAEQLARREVGQALHRRRAAVRRHPKRLAVEPAHVERAPLQREHLPVEPERVHRGHHLLALLVADLHHGRAVLDVAVEAQRRVFRRLLVDQPLEPVTGAPFAGARGGEVARLVQVAEDRLQVGSGQQPREEVGQRLQAQRAGGALQEQAEDLLHRHRGAKGRRARRRFGRRDQRPQQRLLQRRAVEGGRLDRALAAAGATDALGKGRRAARRADEDRHVDGADVDAQFQRAAGKAERGVGLGELLLDLPAALALQVGVVDEDLVAKG